MVRPSCRLCVVMFQLYLRMFIVPDARSEVGVEESKENVANWTTVVTPKRPAAAAAKSASVHVFHASVETLSIVVAA